MRLRHLLLILFAAGYVKFAAWPAWRVVSRDRTGLDFATYHYAWRVAARGGDPYETARLNTAALRDGRRRMVFPYFYPPPFLLGMAWDQGLSLVAARQVFFWLNQLILLGALATLWAWFRADGLVLGFAAATFSPLPDNLFMGQANLPVLLLALIGLWRGAGTWMGAAAMTKMSPALYLAQWAARGEWRPVLVAMATAVALSLLSLPLVGLETQRRFFFEILPTFAGGPYHDLRVPLTLWANHSIPNLWAQLWPGPDDFTVSQTARLMSLATTLTGLAGITWLAPRAKDALGLAALSGATTVLLTLTPVYTYEHHLVFLLLPIAALGTALLRRRLPGWAWVPALLCYVAVAWPLSHRPELERAAGSMRWWLQESKCLGSAGLGLLCAWASARRAEPAAR